jgi:hypothetical protein
VEEDQMERRMEGVKVYVSDNNKVLIEQAGPLGDDDGSVELHPDQIDVVVAWLKQAQVEATESRRTDATR